jgi:hypothetical protein
MNPQSFFGKGYVQVLMTLVLIGIIAALSAYAYYTIKQSEGVYTGAASITVQGIGEAVAVPDIGTFSFSVLAEGATAEEAQTKSADSVNKIIAYLTGAGVEEKDIKTENYFLNPKYRYDTEVCAFDSYCPPSNPVIDGYEVSQMVTVTVRNLDTSGELISGAGTNGATNISSLQFEIDDETAIKAEARSNAIADAKVKAEALSKELGVEIVKMTGFWEDEGGAYPVMDAYRAMGGEEASFKTVTPEMPTGENTYSSSVSITYEVK